MVCRHPSLRNVPAEALALHSAGFVSADLGAFFADEFWVRERVAANLYHKPLQILELRDW